MVTGPYAKCGAIFSAIRSTCSMSGPAGLQGHMLHSGGLQHLQLRHDLVDAADHVAFLEMVPAPVASHHALDVGPLDPQRLLGVLGVHHVDGLHVGEAQGGRVPPRPTAGTR